MKPRSCCTAYASLYPLCKPVSLHRCTPCPTQVWSAWVDPENKPVRACVAAPMAHEDILVEVMVVAAQTPPARSARGGASSGGGRDSVAAPEDSCKLFVGGLAWETDDFSLREAFEEFGAVDEAVVIMMRDDPTQSRGFGFVTFAEPEGATTAVGSMDGAELDGREIRVVRSRSVICAIFCTCAHATGLPTHRQRRSSPATASVPHQC